MTNQTARATAAPVELETRPLSELIREDIVEGRFRAGERLVVADLAKRYGSSSNPVREALHQLQGEGFVVIPPNRGARVRSHGEEFVRNVYELRAVIEPYLVRWFVDNATDAEIAAMEAIQDEIEATQTEGSRFQDVNARYRELNERFHGIVYNRHYNTEAVELEFRQREVLFMLNSRHALTRVRWRDCINEHRGLIDAVKRHDADAAARVTERHVRGACEHLLQQMRAERVRGGQRAQ